MSNREVERRLRMMIAAYDSYVASYFCPAASYMIFEKDAEALRIAAERFITKRQEKKCQTAPTK